MASARERFIEFLTETLIPDLEEAGYEGTPQDFRTAVKFMDNPRGRHDGYTMHGFIDFLEGTLIPDLYESGMTATAEDFETAVKVMLGHRITW